MMERYEKYKDSGVEWIGEIPEGWGVNALKRFAKICNGEDHKKVWDENGAYPIIGSGGVFGKSNKFLYDQPSVILGRKGTIDKPRYIDTPFWTVDTAYYTDISPKTDKRFFYYLCLTINFGLYKYGSAVPSMNQETLSQIPFTSPPKPEQTAIANYLDRKTAEIDQLIAQKERLLSLYEEEKTAIINQAVTQGINPDVKLKDSGIDWLGEIPEHWEVKKLKFLISNLESGVSVNSTDFPASNQAYGILKTSCVYNYVFDSSENKEIWQSELIRTKINPRKGELIISRMNTPELVGASGYVDKDYGNLYLPDRLWQTVFKFGVKIDTKWLSFVLKAIRFRMLLSVTATGTSPSMKNLTQEDFLRIVVPFPVIKEQTAIVQHIETETTRINAKINKTKKIIALQKEYRTALISEVVTGKIKVTLEVAS